MVADSGILSMFGKAGTVSHLKQLFGVIFIPLTEYDELRRAKETGFDFVDELIDSTEILNLSGDEFSEFVRLANDE